jgi:hypothetical protein
MTSSWTLKHVVIRYTEPWTYNIHFIFQNTSAQYSQSFQFQVIKDLSFIFSNTSAQFSQTRQFQVIKDIGFMFSILQLNFIKTFNSILSNTLALCSQTPHLHVLKHLGFIFSNASTPCFYRSKFIQNFVPSVSFSPKETAVLLKSQIIMQRSL